MSSYPLKWVFCYYEKHFFIVHRPVFGQFVQILIKPPVEIRFYEPGDECPRPEDTITVIDLPVHVYYWDGGAYNLAAATKDLRAAEEAFKFHKEHGGI